MRTIARIGTRAALSSLVAVAVLVGLTAAPVKAGPIMPCAPMRAFTFVFSTGGDDLRGNSELALWLLHRDGMTEIELQHVWGPINNWNTRTYSITYQHPNMSFSACDIKGVKIRLISHNDFLQTDDYWNMESMSMTAHSIEGRDAYFLSANGAPAHRFGGGGSIWTKEG